MTTGMKRPPLPPGYVRQRNRIYHVHGINSDGSLSVYGPVIWDGTRSRYVAHGRAGYRTLSVSESPAQQTLEGVA